jgi:D-threo-aldose 1-dehydrogenase
MHHLPLGNCGVQIPRLVFGTSCLGNLYEAVPSNTKLAVSRQWFEQVAAPVALDSAGKYGAGLALEVVGANLRTLGIASEQVVISNKLGWLRTALRTPEPTFEPGVWANLEHDAVQCINYAGILQCWEQGCELLGEPYRPQLVSVHDPDEYLAASACEDDRRRRLADILEAYRALSELKARGEVRAVGVGSKDWRIIQEIDAAVELDWVMLANSLTIYRHPPELVQFAESLAARGIGVINSAVFHAGFLVGGRFFDYRIVRGDEAADRERLAWREAFFAVCHRHCVEPDVACIQFALSAPGVVAVAMNTSNPAKIARNARAVEAAAPNSYWRDMKERGLIRADYAI